MDSKHSAPGADKRLVFVIGGARSGKSAFALKLAGQTPGQRVYMATARAGDAEMKERIRLHREVRGPSWTTVEEETELGAGITGIKGTGTVLVDCLTLWITNLMHAGVDDNGIFARVDGFLQACRDSSLNVVAVSNEVGLSIVPENQLARRFRDLSGTVNQRVASSFGEVYLVAAGIPLRMK